jgi:hypothetical protein
MDKIEQKELAVKCLEILDVYKPYITKFKTTGMPCFFEHFAGFYVDQEPMVYMKMKAIEEEYGVLVYAITHNINEYGELWSMLCVPSDCDKIEDVLDKINQNEFYAFTYTWNQSNPIFSEFGDVVVKSYGGGLKRIT